MLHILWIIFLVLLWIILGLLALGIILLLIVLLSPVNYRIRYKKNKGDFKTSIGDITVTYLFSQIKFQLIFKDLSLKLLGRIFWKRIKPTTLYKLNEDKLKGNSETVNRVINENKDIIDNIGKKIENDNQLEALPKLMDIEEGSNRNVNNLEPVSSEEIKPFNDLLPKENKKKNKKKNIFSRIYNRLYKSTRLFLLPNKILIKLRNFFEKIHSILRKRRKIKELYLSKETRYQLKVLWRWIKRLLKKIFPKNNSGRIIFDLENPSYVGYILAIYGITYKWHKGQIKLISDIKFKNELYINIKLEGKIIPMEMLFYGIRIYFNKDLRNLYKKIKNREV